MAAAMDARLGRAHTRSVVFRDGREALEARIAAIESELDAMRAETSRSQAERDTHLREIRARARKLTAKRLGVPVLVIAVGLVALATQATATTSSSETLYGIVQSVSGQPPVAEDTRCAAFVHVEDAEEDTVKIDVLCDGRILYGGGTYGYMECDDFSSMPSRCADTVPTSEGGDPMLRFDRARRTLTVEDRSPRWQVTIDLGPWAQPYGRDDD
jgi:hypothetical protein